MQTAIPYPVVVQIFMTLLPGAILAGILAFYLLTRLLVADF